MCVLMYNTLLVYNNGDVSDFIIIILLLIYYIILYSNSCIYYNTILIKISPLYIHSNGITDSQQLHNALHTYAILSIHSLG